MERETETDRESRLLLVVIIKTKKFTKRCLFKVLKKVIKKGLRRSFKKISRQSKSVLIKE